MTNLLGSVELVAGSWDLRTFLQNSFRTLDQWFSLAAMVVGLVAIAWATWQIVSSLMSQGKKQINWAVAIILLLVGGALSMSNGFQFVRGIANSGQKTINDLGGQTIVMFQYIKSFLP